MTQYNDWDPVLYLAIRMLEHGHLETVAPMVSLNLKITLTRPGRVTFSKN